jgi:superfamily II DNA/RNA helicase
MITISAHVRDLTIKLFIGSHSQHDYQLMATANPHVTVCAPGRVLELVSQGHLQWEHVQMLCLDESDEPRQDSFFG